MPEWKIPSDDPTQPHLVQLAAILCDADTRAVVSSFNVIVKAENWDIPDEVVAVHGITKEISLDFGISENLALEMIFEITDGAKRVAFNKTFDQRIIRIGAKRYFNNEEVMERWAVKEDHDCAMRLSREVMGGKQPKATSKGCSQE